MNDENAWNIDGFDPETREAAKLAARKSGLSLAEWLNRTIRHTAARELSGADRGGADGRLPALPMEQMVAALAKQLDRHTEEVKAAVAQELASTGPGGRELDELRRAIRETATDIAPATASMNRVARDLETLTGMSDRVDQAGLKAEKATMSVAPMERTMRKMADRLHSLEEEQAARRRGIFGRLFRD